MLDDAAFLIPEVTNANRYLSPGLRLVGKVIMAAKTFAVDIVTTHVAIKAIDLVMMPSMIYEIAKVTVPFGSK